LKQDPQAFGYLKGRWVVRDIANALNEEGIPISFKHVHNVLKDLGLSYKRPKLIVRSNDSQYRRKEKQVRNYKASAILGKKKVLVAFQDEVWTELYPRVEVRWMEKGKQDKIDTPGYNKRRNVFVTLFWPKKSVVYNKFEKRRSGEFKPHLSNVIAYAKRYHMKRIILFIDHATYHKTKNVKKFIRKYLMLKVKFLPKKAPHLNPVEKLVNAPMKSVVCSNRSYRSIE